MAKMNRRTFLSGAGGAFAVPWLVPSSALGLDGAVAPSNRIVVAGIGLGRRGRRRICGSSRLGPVRRARTGGPRP